MLRRVWNYVSNSPFIAGLLIDLVTSGSAWAWAPSTPARLTGVLQGQLAHGISRRGRSTRARRSLFVLENNLWFTRTSVGSSASLLVDIFESSLRAR